jgi:hypothetical protein
MRSLLVTALLLAVVSQAQYYPKAWVDLFQPPYQNCPEIMMSIGCVSSSSCYVPGGSNGVGFGVYNFDGTENGNFNPLNDIDNSPIDFLLQVGVGGTAANPKGAVGGMGLAFGLKYFVNSTTLSPALTTPFTATLSIRTAKSGNEVILIDSLGASWDVMYSSNGGVEYNFYPIPNTSIPDPACTMPVYQTIAADGVWYVVATSFPPSNNGGSSSSSMFTDTKGRHFTRDPNLRYVNEHTAILRPGGDLGAVMAAGWKPSKKHPHVLRRSGLEAFKAHLAAGSGSGSGAGGKCGYSAAILRTTDMGKTWTTFNFQTTSWSISDIDCVNATHCVAVGGGIGAGSLILGTTDGTTWNTLFSLPSTPTVAYMLTSIRYNPADHQEIWAAGGLDTESGGSQGVFYYSQDGGATWKKHGALNFVGEVIQMSFTSSGDGFAVGVTIFDDSTIMRYTHNGPPATPAPSWSGNFSQIQCADNACSQNCTVFSFPQNVCLNLTSGGSAKAFCDMTDQVLMQDVYPIDQVCWGPAAPQPMPLNQCFEANGGGSFLSVCGPVTAAPPSVKGIMENGMTTKAAMPMTRKGVKTMKK